MNFVGNKVREVRKNKKMTLKELSKLTNLSVSFISQVERGESSLTVTSLKKIADALELSMQVFLDEDDNQTYTRKNVNQRLLHFNKLFADHVRLSGNFENRKLEALIMTMEPGNTSIEAFSHEGEEFYYIIKGKAIFIIDGKEYLLSEGESIHYPSTVEHTVTNPFDEEVEILGVSTPKIF